MFEKALLKLAGCPEKELVDRQNDEWITYMEMR